MKFLDNFYRPSVDASAPDGRSISLFGSSQAQTPTAINYVQATITLTSTASSQVVLVEISPNNQTWTVVGRVANSQNALLTTQSTQNQINIILPPMWWFRVRQTEGTAATSLSVSEQTLGLV